MVNINFLIFLINHVIFLIRSEKGEVFGWGNTEYGQLEVDGDRQQINVPLALKFLKGLGRIVDIAAGGSSCLVLTGNCV